MSAEIEVPLKDVNNNLPEDTALICFASFETRCYTLAKLIDFAKINLMFVFRNTDQSMSSSIDTNFATIMELKEDAIAVPVNLDSPVTSAGEILSVVLRIKKEQIKNIVVDISTFTHETLLMLIKTLCVHRNFFEKIILIYNGASEYSDWLSIGCKNVRNVVGYPGFFNPAYKDHMIILTGFEKERATRLVELFEPDVLSIGNGIEPIHNHHLDMMNGMKEEFEEWFYKMPTICHTTFEFSCSNIRSTVDILEGLISQAKGENIILVPLNTKLSTVAVALVALSDNRVQIVYPIAEAYNIYYSKPNDSFVLIDLLSYPEFRND